MRDGPESVGLTDLEVECWVSCLVAQTALQTGIRLHGGVTRPKSVCEPFEGIWDANAKGAETLAIALEGHFKGHGAVNEFVEEATPITKVDKFIDQLEAQLEEKKITIELDSSAKLTLAKKGFDPVFGARPLARVIQEDIKKPLAEEILFGQFSSRGGIVYVEQEEEGLVLKLKESIKDKDRVS